MTSLSIYTYILIYMLVIAVMRHLVILGALSCSRI